MFVQTSAIVQVHVDGLAPPKGTEGHHVFVRVERDAVESSGVTKFRVDRNLVAWDDKPHAALSHRLATERDKYYSRLLTCVCVPDVRHPVFAAREDQVPARCESAVDPLSVVGGSSVLLHGQTGRIKRGERFITLMSFTVTASSEHGNISSSDLHSQIHHP